MTQLSTAAPPARAIRRRLRVALAMFAVLIVGLGGTWWYLAWSEEREYQEALAETDRLDPGWRYADIIAARSNLPDESNAAMFVLAMRRRGAGGGIRSALEEQIGALPRNVELNAEQVAGLRKFFGADPKLRAEANRLKDMTRGRFSSTYDPKTANLIVDWVQQARELEHYLQLSALLAAQDGNPREIADVCLASINNARSMGDEPTIIGLLVRNALMENAMYPLERALAQVELPSPELKAIQESLQREIDEPRLVWTFRGKRGLSIDMIEATGAGRLPRAQLVGTLKGPYAWLPNWLPIPVTYDRAGYLRGMNALVEASKQPVEKQLDAVEETLTQLRGRDWLLDGVMARCRKSAAAHVRGQARLRCAVTALAAERYRQEHRNWPVLLETLITGGQLKAVPLDPYDGRPLRYRRMADGVLVYSVGVDRTDDGGRIDRSNPVGTGVDLGFQLYDPESRRLPARPE